MMKYKIAKGWAIFIYLLAPLLIGLSVWLLTLPFQDGDLSPNASWILIPISLAMIVLMVFGLIDVYKGQLIITENKITSISSISTKELLFDEIKGYTVNENYIFVEPNVNHKKRIKISSYIGGYNEILFWCTQNFSDLDELQAMKEEKEILNDESLGWTKKEREEKLLRAKKTAKIINWVAGISAAWAFFYPTPYQYSILLTSIIPIIALFLIKTSNGLIRIDEKKESVYPSVVYAFVYPSLAIMVRSLLDFEIFNYENVWLPVIVIMVSFLLLLIIKQKEIAFKKKMDILTVVSLSLFLFAYSLGVVIHYNCYYDESEVQVYTAKVLSKRVSSGKTTTRYLEITSWGPQKEIDEVSVGKGFYNRAEIGDQIFVYFRQGKIEIPWFEVKEKNKIVTD